MEVVRASRDYTADPKRKLRRPYDEKAGVFPCRSFNLGKQSVSYPHVDDRNLAQSWCTVTPLGQFDPDAGGHLVLWDFRLVIRFPPGSTIMFPSALLLHSNTPIQPGETRHSIVQYAAGGLGRWVDYDLMTKGTWYAQATEEEAQLKTELDGRRWKAAASTYTKMDELVAGG